MKRPHEFHPTDGLIKDSMFNQKEVGYYKIING